MSAELFFALLSLAAIAGFGSGFIGVGGGLLLFPLLLYVPPHLGLQAIDPKTVAALVLSQVFFGGLVGGTAHWRQGRVHKKLTLVGGVASSAGAFLGGIASKWASEWFLLLLFGIVTLIAGAVMFLPAPSAEKEAATIEAVSIPFLALSAIALAIGLVVGLLGAGNFLFVPLLIYALKIPTRISIGSSLVIFVVNGFAGFLGKLATGQIPLFMTIAIIAGASLGAIAGERCHRGVSPQVLRYAYAGVIAIVALRIWSTLLGP
ncbi:MAG: sulfite exporter TauE/SafE family protein [Candidatus Binatia bacterium]